MKHSFLGTLALLLLAAGTAVADDDLSTFEIEETVVTATRSEEPVAEVPQPVTVVDSERMIRVGADNAGEVLDFVPGVRIIRNNGTVGANNGVSIRSLNGGPASNKSLVLLDGRPMNEPWSGGIDWNAIPFEMVDRIEVVRGPGSALYGSQATAGVISIFTKKPAPGFHGWASVGSEFEAGDDITDSSAEGYGRPEIAATRFNLNGSWGGERFDHFLSLGVRRANQSFPTPNENDWDNTDILYKASGDVAPDLRATLTLDYHDNSWDIQADRSPYEEAGTRYGVDGSVRWLAGAGIVNGRVYLTSMDTRNMIYATDLETGYVAHRTGLMADYSRELAQIGTLIAGVDVQYDTADYDYEKTVVSMTRRGVDEVNVFDSRTGTYSQVEADTFTGRYGATSQTYDLSNSAAFVQLSRDIGERITVVAGGRLDHHSEFGTEFTPKAGATWDVYERAGWTTTLKANAGTAFRAPPMWGLFSNDVGGYGDPDLEPEKSTNFDLGIFQRLGDLGRLEATWFYMDVRDLLINDKAGSTGEGYYVFVPTAAGTDTISFNQRMNLGDYSPTGAEVGLTLTPHRCVTVFGSYSYLDPGDFTFQTSRHRFNLGVNGTMPLTGDLTLDGGVTYRYTGEGYFFDYESMPYDAYSLTDLRASVGWQNRYRLTTMVKNVFDTTYREWHYYWMPGRTVQVSIETSF